MRGHNIMTALQVLNIAAKLRGPAPVSNINFPNPNSCKNLGPELT